jgi:3-hydroxyacyl-[acyl-carrier-protein] dehydratase
MSESEPNTPVMDIHAIWKRLPHRYPFLLVDRVLEIEPGERALALKNVTINEPFFQGHFPVEPVMPGVLIIEAMAQAGGILVAASREDPGLLVFLASVRSARFRRPVRPGDQLLLEVTAQSVRSVAPRVSAKARVGDTIVAEAEIMFAFQKPEA